MTSENTKGFTLIELMIVITIATAAALGFFYAERARAAIERASTIRLRPILMTTVAMLVAMVPLLTASGPGAVSRFHIGLVITTGLGIGTLFTLFVVPAVYLLLAREHHAVETVDGTGDGITEERSS